MTTLRPATAADAEGLAALHALAFEAPWSARDIMALMASPGGYALLAEGEGFILCRTAGGEAEILTLAVDPAVRRRGVGRTLVEAACAIAQSDCMFLEVAQSNEAAKALYRVCGFHQAGLRRGYYAGEDALVLRRDL